MKGTIRRLLRGFYWVVGVSAYLGLTVGLPYLSRGDIPEGGWQWWYITLIFWVAPPFLVGFYKLHKWAFGE